MSNFPHGLPLSDPAMESTLSELRTRLMDSYRSNRITRYDSRIKGDLYEYKVNLSKPIIDEIDQVLARHYGFSDEELDFIINYDIKYRMGRAAADGGEVNE
jgi:hypothetical protein